MRGVRWSADEGNSGNMTTMRKRGEFGIRHTRPATRALVGATGFAGTGFAVSPDAEMDEIDDAALTLGADLLSQLLALSGARSAADLPAAVVAHHYDPRFTFYAEQWLPWLARWHAFAREQSSWWKKGLDIAGGPLWSRDRYFGAQPWRDSLRNMYLAAKGLGFHVSGAAPAPANTPIGEAAAHGAEAAASWLGDAAHAGKYILYGGLALGAALVIATIASDLKTGNAPTERYARYAGRAGRAALV